MSGDRPTCTTPGCTNPVGFWPDLCRACDKKALDESVDVSTLTHE